MAGTVLALALLSPAAGAGAAGKHERTPLATTPHFAFYSDFATNLNDALIAAGLARNRRRPELFHSGAEEGCFDGLAPSARAGWDRAVDYYAEIISPADWDDRQQYLVRVDLAGFDDELTDDRARQFVGLAASFRGAATPAYEACRWAAQDAANRRWIEDVKAQLDAHEKKIAGRLEELYGKPWGGLPVPVDVVETVNWAGANSILREPAGGHLLVSNSTGGPVALETVFHEASHLLMDRRDPVRKALAEAAASLDRPLPGDLWHVVLFVTTGETVRARLDAAGEPGYSPMIDAICERNEKWRGYRHAIESAWPAYMEGDRTLSGAAIDLVRMLSGDGTKTD